MFTPKTFSTITLLSLAQMEDGKFHGDQPPPPPFFSSILIQGIKFIVDSRPCLSSLSSHPLFSFSVASQVLILLYLPRLFIRLFFSPVLFYTLIFLVITFLSLSLSVGLVPPADKNDETLENESKGAETAVQKRAPTAEEAKTDIPMEAEAKNSRRAFFSATCMDWSSKWPLGVIYEDYEGEEEEDQEEDGVASPGLVGTQSNHRLVAVQGFEDWGLYLPDSDSGSSCSSEREYPEELPTWESVGNLDIFRWEEDDEEEAEREGMIEILLGGKGFSAGEEESLIEIDLSAATRT